MIVLHLSQVEHTGTALKIQFNNIVCPRKTKRGVSAKCAGAYYCYAPFTLITKASVEKLRFVLMAMESNAETAIDKILENLRIHIVGLHWQAFRIMVPDSHADPLLIQRVAQGHSRTRDAIRMDVSLHVKNIVIIKTKKSDDF